MNHTEQAAMFACGGEALVGVLSVPERMSDTALVVIVGGPQYRAGSHRQFVMLARTLAAAGHAVLRFDHRGMGDSGGPPRDFESVSDDVGAAIDLLQQRLPSVRQVVLWGLCDGASAALLYCDQTQDSRVLGVCALNPWVRSEAGLAKTQLKHYYTRRLLQPEFWRKLLRGGVAGGAWRELMQKLATVAGRAARPSASDTTSFRQRMARAWRRLDGRVLLVLSEQDYTAKEFAEHAQADAAWRGALGSAACRLHRLADADHTFSSAASRRATEQLVLQWLDDVAGAAASDHRKAA